MRNKKGASGRGRSAEWGRQVTMREGDRNRRDKGQHRRAGSPTSIPGLISFLDLDINPTVGWFAVHVSPAGGWWLCDSECELIYM